MDATATTQCPTCGSSIPGDTAFGACPACLFGAALDDGGSASASGSSSEAESPERYQILGQIGEGAFGEVYAAEQREPVRRRVALKLLKRGMDTRQVVARFEGERQALAVLDHANIAAVFDAGETPGGRPFIAMELVEDGVSVTDFCLRESLDLRARLSVFLQVCEAIRHAHQKGIIHRDIKPSNILVSLAGGAGRTPKVIDFGIAKATEDVLSARTLYTDPGKFVGTPAYMAPEQFADGSATPASDIFSLGLVLHEIFTGERAIRASTLSELHARHTTPFAGPSERVAGLDPAVDSAVRRCLALAPADRPDSALRVAGALPGGDPLAQALAAGETPSPELVARAEGPPALSGVIVASLLAVAVIAFGFVVWLFGNNSIYQLDGTPLERAVLEHRARELASAGGAFELAPGSGRFELDDAAPAISTREAIGSAAERRPGLVQFVYRAG
ncbi:MAG: serine/threonine protein kinase, partial [Planctomycetes bacterium]|nr:serine/threonine protein kinase [Planctomycetota bacterium]